MPYPRKVDELDIRTYYEYAYAYYDEYLLLANETWDILEANGGNQIILRSTHSQDPEIAHTPSSVNGLCIYWKEFDPECQVISMPADLEQKFERIKVFNLFSPLSEVAVTQNNVYFIYTRGEYVVIVSKNEPMHEDWTFDRFDSFKKLHFEKNFYVYSFENYECPLFGIFNCYDMNQENIYNLFDDLDWGRG